MTATKLYATTGSVRTHLIRTASLASRTPRTWCHRDMPTGCGLAEHVDTMANMCPECVNAYTAAGEAKREVERARQILDTTRAMSVTNRRRRPDNPTPDNHPPRKK